MEAAWFANDFAFVLHSVDSKLYCKCLPYSENFSRFSERCGDSVLLLLFADDPFVSKSSFVKMLFGRNVGTQWRQFRLRTLLLATLTIALVFPMVVFPAKSQRRSREWVLSQNGRVVLDPRYQLEGAWYVSKDAWSLPRLVVDTMGIDFFASAKIVILDCNEICDLSDINRHGRLEELYIYQFVHDKKTFDNLKSLRHLKKLKLSEWADYPTMRLRPS